ncbi:MAG: septum formation initiator family protein [Deltaproteobacteria bacterium]|nr:MAG: septum formation initiator family protein [Deltaproteobacteria bacterium]
MASFKKNYYLAYILILSFVAFLLLAWLSLGQNGLIDLYKMQEEKGRYLAIINDLKEKNRLLTAEIRRLREDQRYFESVARRELGLVKSNEIIYRFRLGGKGNRKANGNKE